jgi:PadR family transcriptional regulator PadR
VNIQFNKGVLELCVLSTLSQKDYSGYQLFKVITKSVKIPEGSFYPLLNRLTKEGYLDTYYIATEDSESRKFYKLTPSGLEAKAALLDKWQSLTDRINELLVGDRANE